MIVESLPSYNGYQAYLLELYVLSTLVEAEVEVYKSTSTWLSDSHKEIRHMLGNSISICTDLLINPVFVEIVEEVLCIINF